MAKKVYIQDIELTGGGSGGEVAWDDITDKPTFAGVATSGDYADLDNKPDLNTKQDTLISGENIKTVNNESLLGPGNIEIEGGGAFVATYDQTSYTDVKDAIDANKPIVVDFPNNKNLIMPTYCTYAVGGNITMYGIYKSANAINMSTITVTPGDAWTIVHDDIQPKLVSGGSIKTINNISLLGSGNIDVGGDVDFKIIEYGVTPHADIDADKPFLFKNASNYFVPITGVGGDESGSYIFYRNMFVLHDGAESSLVYQTATVDVNDRWTETAFILPLQDTLVSGENIKTINNQSLLGPGNINIEGGDGVFVAEENVTTYQEALDALSTYKLFVVKSGSRYMYANAWSGDTCVRFLTLEGTNNTFLFEIAQDDTWSIIHTGLQMELASGVNIKTLNNESLLGAGNIDMPLGDLTTLTTEDQSSLVAALNEVYEKCGEPFRVKHWMSNTLNVEIPCCTEDISNRSIPKLTFTINAEEGALYQIVGMIAYEVFDTDSGGTRINCWPVCQFTGNGQKELGVRFMCAGTSSKTAKRISAWVLLKRRA